MNSVPVHAAAIPVVLLSLNRPDFVTQLIERPRIDHLEHILVVADDPREGRPGKSKIYEAVHKTGNDGIDLEARSWKPTYCLKACDFITHG